MFAAIGLYVKWSFYAYDTSCLHEFNSLMDLYLYMHWSVLMFHAQETGKRVSLLEHTVTTHIHIDNIWNFLSLPTLLSAFLRYELNRFKTIINSPRHVLPLKHNFLKVFRSIFSLFSVSSKAFNLKHHIQKLIRHYTIKKTRINIIKMGRKNVNKPGLVGGHVVCLSLLRICREGVI